VTVQVGNVFLAGCAAGASTNITFEKEEQVFFVGDRLITDPKVLSLTVDIAKTAQDGNVYLYFDAYN